MSKKEYDVKYQREKLTSITLRMKPEMKKEIDNAARKEGKSTRAFILDAVYNFIKKGE